MSGKYKIGMVSRHSGVTPQTVRYYEKEDLIASLKDDFSTTRYYNVRHFKQLSNIRRYFKMGLSESEVREMIHCGDLEEMTALLDAKDLECRKKLAEIRRQMEALETMAYNIRRIPSLLGRVVMEQSPAMSFLVTRRGDSMVESPEIGETLSKWLENIHLTSLASIIPLEIIRDTPESPYRLSGHCIRTDALESLGCSADTPGLLNIPPQKCLHTICVLDSNDRSAKKLLSGVYEALLERGLTPCGDAFGQALAVLAEADNRTNERPRAAYYEYWLPVR